MKKIIAAGMLSALLVFTMAGCGNDAQNNEGAAQTPSSEAVQNNNENTAPKAAVSENDAKASALKHAGLKESDVTFIRQELEHDDGMQVYEIDFDANGKEYDYTIDAQTGEILSASEEMRYEGTAQKAGVEIGEEKAKSIALKKVKGAAEGDNNVRVYLESDDGWKVYEGDILHNNMQYEFEIDAVTGDILSWSEERYGID